MRHAGIAGRKMLGHLNRSINGAIRSTQAIVPWLPPLAALSQPGNCKSYAIAKGAFGSDIIDPLG
jgi:hypothetical protein